ncbi:unnamed protein product [Cyclocybe aegerita]|uniref:F-box domain-containing protein n=1 Tax=Cyclocybe aegerita TaxID=1973307 RepID=A0A8S0X2N3_CYCAE|nr:unnamed protein product [Cyclocybe aegerita]
MADPRPSYATWKQYIKRLEDKEDKYERRYPHECKKPPPPLHYPHHLAGVCEHFHDILLDSPRLWTTIVVFLDFELIETISDLKMSLRFSQDFPLDVSVDHWLKSIRDRGFCDDENIASRAVIKILRLHFHRCRTIEYSAVLGTSLPSPSRDLSALSSTLESLILKCKFDDEHPNGILFGEDPAPILDLASSPLMNLEDLYLSGYTVMDACRNAPQLVQAAQATLILRDYQATRSGEPAKQIVPHLLKALTHAPPRHIFWSRDVVLYDIDVSHWQAGMLYKPFCMQGVATLTLTGLEGGTMSNLLDYVDFSDASLLTVTRCHIPEGVRRFGYGEQLHLDDLRGWPDLVDLLEEWNGLHLSIMRHAGPLDLILRLLAKRRKAGKCSMNELLLDDCTNFSVRAMKRLCKSRRPTDMDNVAVCGIGPVISTEERCWFESVDVMDGTHDG